MSKSKSQPSEPEPPKLKRWDKAKLRPEDYDFSACLNWPRRLQKTVEVWELDRELGSGKGPFLRLKSCRNWVKEQLDQPQPGSTITERPLHQLKEFFAQHPDWRDSSLNAENLPGGGVFSKVYALEIDLTQRNEAIVEDFQGWLKSMQRPQKPFKRPRQSMKTLFNLGIYRAKSSGVTCNADLPEKYPSPQHLANNSTRTTSNAFPDTRTGEAGGIIPDRVHQRTGTARKAILLRHKELCDLVADSDFTSATSGQYPTWEHCLTTSPDKAF